MDIRHLRYFTTVADEGGVTKAAARLNVSQPALSRQIHALQDELGVDLFEPIGRNIQLTPQGQELLGVARRVIRDLEQFRDRASAYKAGRAGILRVASTPQSIESILADGIAAFIAEHPEVQVQFIEGGGAEMSGLLKRGDADLVVSFFDLDQTLESRPYCRVPFWVVVPLDHRLAGRDVVDIREISADRLLALRSNFGSRYLFETACRLVRMKPNIIHESNSAHTLIALAAAGHGIAVIPATVKVHREDIHLAQLHFNNTPLHFELFAAWNPTNPLPPYGHAMIEHLGSWFQEERPVPIL